MGMRRGLYDENGSEVRERQRVVSYALDAVCSVDGCAGKPKGRGLCNAHWLEAKNGKGKWKVPSRKKKVLEFIPCLLEGCDRRASNRGMCGSHANKRDRGMIDAEGRKLRDRLKPGRKRTKPRVVKDGYVLVYAPEGHSKARKDGRIYEHRLVMEDALGRPLEDYEIVHHKNGQRGDNRLENLELMDGRARQGEGHPPASDIDYWSAVQVVAQNLSTPAHVVRSLRKLQRESGITSSTEPCRACGSLNHVRGENDVSSIR